MLRIWPTKILALSAQSVHTKTFTLYFVIYNKYKTVYNNSKEKKLRVQALEQTA